MVIYLPQGLSAEGRPSSPLTVGIEPENVDGHGGGRDLTHNPVSRANGPASERLTSSLSVARDRGKRSSAQRWAGPYSHGGSQGFKSPHLHPTLMSSGNAGHRHVRVMVEPAERMEAPHCASSAAWTPRCSRLAAPLLQVAPPGAEPHGVDDVTGPPCRPCSRRDPGRLADPFDSARRDRDPWAAPVVAGVARTAAVVGTCAAGVAPGGVERWGW
jgi:hypothetical protein